MASIARQLAIIVVLAGAGYGGWQLWRSQDAASSEAPARARAAPGVVVAAVALDRVERTVAAVGAARPLRSVALATLSDGRITELGFSGGERVRAGQALLKLDDATERATVQEAQADLDRASNAFDRAYALYTQRRLSETEFDAARAGLSGAEARLERAQKALEDRTVLAPFDGVAGFRMADVGAVVRANTPVADLADISALDVDFAVPERFYGEVRAGAEVRATTQIFPGEAFDGVVTSVSPRIDTVSRSFTARARIPNPDLRLPGDAFMRVTLVLAARQGVLAPEEAVVSEAGETYVYVVAQDRAERRAVTVGARLKGRAEITQGLAPGEMVITRGVQKVGDGRAVRVIEIEGEGAALSGRAAAPGA